MLKQKHTVCARDCYDSCSMIYSVNEKNEITNVYGDKFHPITKGFLCKRGHAELKRIYSKDRIKQPYIRIKNKLIPISWQQAINLAAEAIQHTSNKYGSKHILFLTYDGNAGLIHNIFFHRIWHKLNVTMTDMAICTNTGHTILEKHFGASNGITPSELPKQKLIIFWGMNPAVTGPHIWAKAIEARKNGAKIVTIDPIYTTTAKHSDYWLQINPGTDTALALFVINQIISKNKHDKNFIKKYTSGFDKLEQASRIWNIKKTVKFTSISQNSLKLLVNDIITAKPLALMMGVALQKADFGWESIRAIAFIQAVLGYHRSFFYSNGRAFYIDYDYLNGSKFHKTPYSTSQVNLTDRIEQEYFKLIINSSMNPSMTLPNTKKFIQAKKQNKFKLITLDTHWSETAKLSDIILPVPTFAEKQDLIVSWSHCYTRFSPPVIPKLFKSKTEIEIMHLLAKKLNLTDSWLYEDPKIALQIAFKNALENGEKLDLSGKIQKLKTKPLDIYPTKNGKINFSLENNPNIPPTPIQPTKQQNLSLQQFLLLSTAVNDYTNTQFRDVFGEPQPNIYLNPADAKKLNITSGDIVTVSNNYDTLTMIAKISNKVKQGVAWTPRAIKDLNNNPLNNIISNSTQKIGKGPMYHSNIVKISKINYK